MNLPVPQWEQYSLYSLCNIHTHHEHFLFFYLFPKIKEVILIYQINYNPVDHLEFLQDIINNFYLKSEFKRAVF